MGYCSHYIETGFLQIGPLGRCGHRVAMSVCLSVCAIVKHPLPEVNNVLVKGRIANFGLHAMTQLFSSFLF